MMSCPKDPSKWGPQGLDRIQMDDQISSGEGGTPEPKPMRRRRTRKLTGSQREAFGELLFVLYNCCDTKVPFDVWRELLSSAVLRLRARFM